MVETGLFPQNPEAVRGGYRALAAGFAVVGVLLFCGLPMLGLDSAAMMCIPFAFGSPAVLGFVLAGVMPRKTPAGAEQAARWRAFARYLADLQRFGDVNQAAQRFGDFLPYAVAMGVDQQYTRQFDSVQGQMPMPTYYYPWGWMPGYGYGVPGVPGARGLAGAGVAGPGGAMAGGGPDFSPG